MLRTMRENTKWIMLITALAFVGLMVFEWGMDLSGRSSMIGFSGDIGKVNGTAIAYEEYHEVLQNLQRERQATQPQPLTAGELKELEELAWEQVVMEYLIRQEIRKRGLEATPTEIRQAARFAPPPELYEHELFQTDGQFDPTKYQEFLASPAVDEIVLLQLEAYYRDLISRNKLFQQVVSTSYLSDGELWRAWRDQTERASIRYLALNPDAMVSAEEVTVSDSEIADFFREHRRDFVRPANARIKIAVLPKEATAADTAAAREHALELRRRIVEDGEDFAEIARLESSDPGSAARGGDLGTFTRGQMVPAFEQAVWGASLNTLTEPVQTSYGFHLIRVTSRSGDEATASHILIPIVRGDETEDAILTAADSLEHLALITTIDEAAEELGLSVREAEITAELPIIVGAGRIDEGSDWAFDEEVEIGELSPLFETADNFYIFEILDRRPEKALTLEEASPGIRDRLIERKRYQQAVRLGRDLIDQVKRTSLEEVASIHETSMQITEPFSRFDFVPGIGQANAVVGAAFGLEPGQTSGLLEANGLLYIIEGVERIPADRETFEAERDEIRSLVASEIQQQRWNLYLLSLKDEAKVVDNRDRVLAHSHAH